MTEPEKPLYVRVAEALGCNTIPLEDGPNDPMWWCDCVEEVEECPATGYITGGRVRRYDTDWSATGPLIEKYGIGLMVVIDDHRKVWRAYWDRKRPECKECGATYRRDEVAWPNMIGPWTESPLVSVCNLILALKAAGKLA